MGMDKNCHNCTEKCPQAERANQAALGRMYATKEFIALLKKVESGELVEVVRCKDCRWLGELMGKDSGKPCGYGYCKNPIGIMGIAYNESYCSYGERKDND